MKIITGKYLRGPEEPTLGQEPPQDTSIANVGSTRNTMPVEPEYSSDEDEVGSSSEQLIAPAKGVEEAPDEEQKPPSRAPSPTAPEEVNQPAANADTKPASPNQADRITNERKPNGKGKGNKRW